MIERTGRRVDGERDRAPVGDHIVLLCAYWLKNGVKESEQARAGLISAVRKLVSPSQSVQRNGIESCLGVDRLEDGQARAVGAPEPRVRQIGGIRSILAGEQVDDRDADVGGPRGSLGS